MKDSVMRQVKTIELIDLSIGYKHKQHKKIIAEHINCSIYSGELTCLLGANGVGKSTLLRTLSSFQCSLAGKILIEGKDVVSYSEKDFSKLVSVVLTDRFSIKNMTARELIGLGRSPYTGFWGRLNDEDEAIVDEAICQVKIENLANRMIDTLSDGERQKCLIAKALVQDTPIILLDEPTAFLDFPSKVELMQLLHQLSRTTNKTIFLSTHDLELALQIADKVWLMDRQTGITIGTPEDLSLNGSLSNFFQRKGISFDKKTGLFRVANDYNKQVNLIGHGYYYAMIRKALLRNGILAERAISSTVSIDASSEEIEIKVGGKSIAKVDTIEELLNQMKLL